MSWSYCFYVKKAWEKLELLAVAMVETSLCEEGHIIDQSDMASSARQNR
jgi:hypothetical protein